MATKMFYIKKQMFKQIAMYYKITNEELSLKQIISGAEFCKDFNDRFNSSNCAVSAVGSHITQFS